MAEEGLATRIEALSPEKRALLARRLLGRSAPGGPGAPIPRLGRREAPLSYAQKRMWFLQQLDPGSGAYNVPVALRLDGPIDAGVLERGLAEVVRRHEALRTRFPVVDGEPRQRVEPPAPLPLPVEPVTEEEAARRMRDEAERPFDLEQGPLLRARLLRTDDSRYLLLLTIHHIVFDGFSVPVVLRELDALYAAFLRGDPSPLSELPIQYADFAIWQQQWLREETPVRELAYWREQLAGDLRVLDLPTDRARPRVQTHRGASQIRSLPAGLSDGLKALARSEDATLFMVLLSAFGLLLQRHTGQEQVVLGTPISGRNRVELEGLTGCFLNTLVLRSDLSGDPTFRELLRRVRQVALGAYAHQNVPFEKLLEELQPERDTSRPPLFQALINMHNFNADFDRLFAVPCEILKREDESSKFDLTLYVDEKRGATRLRLVYNADLFRPERMSELLAQLERVAEQAVASPDRPIGACDLLTPEARRRLPDPAAPLAEPRYPLAAELFAARVLEDPQATAVRQDGRRFSYAALSAAAEAVAMALRDQGLRPGEVVAVRGDRSFGLIAAMVGVFSSGAVLLTLDPRLPEARQRLMLQQAGARRLLDVGAPGPGSARADPSLALIRVDPESGRPRPGEPPAAAREAPGFAPGDAAYVFFTSGTTGVPKAVLGSHRGLAHFLDWQRRTFQVGPRDRVAQLTGLSFDVILRDVFLPLTSGAALCLPTPDEALLPRSTLSWLEREEISILHVVPTLASSWLRDVPPGISLRALRFAFFAGEPLPRELVERWRESFPGAGEVVNLYGATETTLVKCSHRVSRPPRHGIQPAGRPLPETQALVLARDHRPCGIGERGEIVLRTPFRTLGYLNAPEEMQSRFVPNPFRDDPRDLLYHTGDRGRYGIDGELEVLGRLDDQVKIRGVRIEPGEVAAVLARHPAVRQSAVIAREDAPGDRRLVAYVVAAPGRALAASELRSSAQRHLPEYMVPSAFVMLEALPLTVNGKLDRRALPAPDAAGETPGTGYVAPRTPLEEITARIWAEVLGVDRVGVHDGFFDLGGHSLLATQVISRLRAECQTELPIRTLFDRPTVAALAEQIAAARLGDRAEARPGIAPAPRTGDLPLSWSEERMWFLHQLDERGAAYNVSNAFRITGPLDLEILADAANALVERHENLRTAFRSVEGRPLREVLARARLELEVIDLRAGSEVDRPQEIQRLATEQAQRPFALSRPPLLRMALLRAGDENHVLVLVMHHIVSDGWSVGIFMQELCSVYDDLSQGRPPSLPPLPVQCADFACWQREWFQRSALGEDLAYWTGRLAGAPLILEVPTDRPRPARQTSRGAREGLEVPEALDAALDALGRREGLTAFMIFFTAFHIVLHRLTGREDILVGTPIANRHWLAAERLIGSLVNTLVLRTDLSGNPTLRELLRRVREAALEAYSHQDLPFEQLVEALQPPRDLSRSPVFQVMFSHQQVPVEVSSPAGLEVRHLPMDRRAAQFDLTLSVREIPGERRRVSLEYNRDLFDRSTIARLLAHLRSALEALVRDPDRTLGEVETLPPAERESLLFGWNETRRPFPEERCLHQLFEAQVRRTPDAVAVVFEGEGLSYRALDQRANRLAHRLSALGVGPDVRVGLCVDRSPDLIVGLLGVLKAGGAYVPLDPGYPAARLELVIEDAGLALLVTQEALRARLPRYAGPVLCLDAAAGEGPQEGAPLDGPRVDGLDPSHLAYVIYTSGSTGRPKGVAVSHRALVNFMSSMQREPGLGPSDALLSVTTVAFDIAALELYLPLLVGARVVLVRREVTLDAERLIAALEESAATVLQATPATFRMLLEAGWSGSGRLKALCGGEALPRDLARRLLDRCGELWNLYGPTETTIWSTLHRVQPGDDRVLIGRPIANTRIYLLDARLRPVALGAVGELYIGGEGLARGYLGRPDQTQERFLPDPFVASADARIYRTGDLARYLPDGRIECLGRVDDQVKVRGFRIELGEVEACLREHPDVEEAVVVRREDAPGAARLVAYARLRSGAETERAGVEGRLRGFLEERIPPYMVPAAFAVLDRLPLTPNGKVDRRALPPPPDIEPATRFVAPRDPLEAKLIEIWRHLLRRQGIGVRDDFFDLGGHSLLGAQLCFRIKRELGRSVPVAVLFQTPTVEGLARYLRGEHEAIHEGSAVPLQPNGSRSPFFFMAGNENHFGQRLGPDQPFYRVPIQDLDQEIPFDRVEDMAEHCIRAIRSVQPEGPYFLGGHCFGGVVAFEVAHQLERRGESVGCLVLVEARVPRSSPLRSDTSRAQRLAQRLAHHRERMREVGVGPEAARILRAVRRKAERQLWQRLAALGWRRGPLARPLRDPRAANHLAARQHVPSRFSGRIVLIRCSDRPGWRHDDPLCGWGAHATRSPEVYRFPGSHTGLYRDPVVSAVAETVNRCLVGAWESPIDAARPEAGSG